MLVYEGTLTVKKIHTSPTALLTKDKTSEKPIGYLGIRSGLSFMDQGLYNKPANIDYPLTKDNFIERLPIWAVHWIDQSDWKSRDFYRHCTEKGDIYKEDKEFLKACLLYSVLSSQNQCRSYIDEDGEYHRNELCLGGDTVALRALAKMELNEDDRQLIRQWTNVMNAAKDTANFNSDITYGTKQIEKELNTRHKVGKNTVYDYPILNGAIVALKHILKTYHANYIEPKAFAYGLIA